MNRRIFLKYLGSIPILSVVWSYLTTLVRADAPVVVPSVRRVRPSDPPWPTAASWEKLKQQVGGQLIPVSSPLAPCMDAPEDRVAAARDTAINPAVPDALALALIAGGDPHTSPGLLGHEPDLAAGRKAALAITAAAEELRAIATVAGAYVSEGNFFENAWQTSFWGSNYPKLAEVKKKYDPAGLFFVHHGVGSEEWSADGFTRLPGR